MTCRYACLFSIDIDEFEVWLWKTSHVKLLIAMNYWNDNFPYFFFIIIYRDFMQQGMKQNEGFLSSKWRGEFSPIYRKTTNFFWNVTLFASLPWVLLVALPFLFFKVTGIGCIIRWTSLAILSSTIKKNIKHYSQYNIISCSLDYHHATHNNNLRPLACLQDSFNTTCSPTVLQPRSLNCSFVSNMAQLTHI